MSLIVFHHLFEALPRLESVSGLIHELLLVKPGSFFSILNQLVRLLLFLKTQILIKLFFCQGLLQRANFILEHLDFPFVELSYLLLLVIDIRGLLVLLIFLIQIEEGLLQLFHSHT